MSSDSDSAWIEVPGCSRLEVHHATQHSDRIALWQAGFQRASLSLQLAHMIAAALQPQPGSDSDILAAVNEFLASAHWLDAELSRREACPTGDDYNQLWLFISGLENELGHCRRKSTLARPQPEPEPEPSADSVASRPQDWISWHAGSAGSAGYPGLHPDQMIEVKRKDGSCTLTPARLASWSEVVAFRCTPSDRPNSASASDTVNDSFERLLEMTMNRFLRELNK